MIDDLAPLRTLLAQAERQRDEALAEQMRLEAQRRAADGQAEQLAGYRREYEARWRDEFSREGRIELIQCYQGFMDKLGLAVEQQREIAVRAAAQVERAEAIVRGHDLRAAALGKLVTRRERQHGQQAARREQRDSDERASLQWQAARRALGDGGLPR